MYLLLLQLLMLGRTHGRRIRTGGDWFHPIHMHLVDFFVLQRGNNAGSDGLFAFERDTPKDVVFLGPSHVSNFSGHVPMAAYTAYTVPCIHGHTL